MCCCCTNKLRPSEDLEITNTTILLAWSIGKSRSKAAASQVNFAFLGVAPSMDKLSNEMARKSHMCNQVRSRPTSTPTNVVAPG
jgi:hypothetical protein